MALRSKILNAALSKGRVVKVVPIWTWSSRASSSFSSSKQFPGGFQASSFVSQAQAAPNLLQNEEYLDGPDQIIKGVQNLTTWRPDGAVKIRGLENSADLPPMSVPTLLRAAAEGSPNSLALASRPLDGSVAGWEQRTFSDYYSQSLTAAKAFISLGLDRFHSVAILGYNAPEWLIAQSGAILAGGFSSGVYTTDSPESVRHIVANARAQIVVVEDRQQLEKVLKVKPDLPHLRAIVQYRGRPAEEGVLSWDELMRIGSGASDSLLDERLKRIAINQCCSLLHTSGTTGPPKGVMLSHDNITWVARVSNIYLWVTPSDRFISYLPLSHAAAQIMDVWMPLYARAPLYFAPRDALRKGGGLVDTLREVRPTIFFGVPRVYDKIREAMTEAASGDSGLKRRIGEWARRVGLERNLEVVAENGKLGWDKEVRLLRDPRLERRYRLARRLVFGRVRRRLGWDAARLVAVGAAPVSRDTLEFFLSLDVNLMECYGMSETTGPHSGNRPWGQILSSIGPTMLATIEGCHAKIEPGTGPEGSGGNVGELMLSGRNICMGYLNEEQKTRDLLDKDGWLHSGDLARYVSEGDRGDYIQITGRLKELLVTSGGKNVAPVPLEDALRSEAGGAVANAMVVGEGKKFLTCLVTLKTEVDSETLEPLPALTPVSRAWLSSEAGVEAETASEAARSPAVAEAVGRAVERANDAAAESNAHRIKKFAILEKDFSIPGGEFGPTMKLRRHFVLEKYEKEIRKMYGEEEEKDKN